MVRNVQIVVGDEFHSEAFELGAFAHDKLWDHVYAVEIFDIAAVYRQVLRTKEHIYNIKFILLE